MNSTKTKYNTLKSLHEASSYLPRNEFKEAVREYTNTVFGDKWKDKYRQQIDKAIKEIVAGIEK